MSLEVYRSVFRPGIVILWKSQSINRSDVLLSDEPRENPEKPIVFEDVRNESFKSKTAQYPFSKKYIFHPNHAKRSVMQNPIFFTHIQLMYSRLLRSSCG